MGEDERMHIVLDVRDNVSTILDTRASLCRLRGGMSIADGIPFGHKVALRPIAPGDPIVKYGVTIGHATRAIAQGEHVHIHNCS